MGYDFAIECIAMLAIYGLIIFDSIRRHHKKLALCTLPLAILPSMHLLSIGVGNFIIDKLTRFNPLFTMLSIDMIAIALTGLVIGIVSRLFHKKKATIIYAVVSFAYTCVIGLILTIDMITKSSFFQI